MSWSTSPPDSREGAIREAIADALQSPSPEGGFRAFAVGNLTCIVRWKPAGPTSAGGLQHHDVSLRLRRDERTHEHATTLIDLRLLARTCEHHLLHFDAETRPTDARWGPRPVSDRDSDELARERLRSLLDRDEN